MTQNSIILFNQINGVLALITPAWNDQKENESEEDFLSRLAVQNIQIDRPIREEGQSDEDYEAQISAADARPWKVMEPTDLPYTCRTFRDAWSFNEETLTLEFDLSRVRVIQMSRIKYKRDKNIAYLDIFTLKGIDNQTGKQVQRDIPESAQILVDAATTFETIVAVWPIELDLYD